MSETQGLVCVLGAIAVPLLVFFVVSVFGFWLAQSMFVSMTGIHVEDISNDRMSRLAVIASIIAFIVATMAGTFWTAGLCLTTA